MPALDAVFHPGSVAFIGGRYLRGPLRYHRDLGFAGRTHVVARGHGEIAGFPCLPRIEDLPEAPDLAFLATPREATVEAVAALAALGCRAAILHAGGFAETGAEGAALQAAVRAAAGEMMILGPNAGGVVNFLEPMAAIMDHFGVTRPERGVAIVSQGGGFLCDAVFADRSLPVTHLIGCGNQLGV
ncbi:MAG: CoA-binding protein, partial [Pseudomonadota bacterium]